MDRELFFVKFPIIFPIIYGALIYLFPNYEIYIIFLTILLLAEPHFAATWPFLLDQVNKNYIDNNKLTFVLVPVTITIACVIGYFFVKNIFLLIFFAANIYHVTRQSFGVSNLYLKNNQEKKYQEYSIYFFNLIFFILGIIRFYLDTSVNNYLNEILYLILSLHLINFIFYNIKFNFKNIYTLISGTIIFLPVCFVNNPIHVIIMGVTMHYSQYLFLTHKIFVNRNKMKFKFIKKYVIYFLIIILYAFLMSSFSMSKSFNISILKDLLLIPIIGQMLHFYFDSQLWKFSKEHNRENVLVHIKHS